MSVQYLSIEHVIAIHDLLIEQFGGSYGIRDQGLLESATHQPQQTFGGQDLYPTLFDKAAAYSFFISENQPFIDGNKRAAASVAAVFLDLNGYLVDCPEGQIYETIMKLANKKISKNDLAGWYQKNCVKKKKI
jgi:death-on-curing protein